MPEVNTSSSVYITALFHNYITSMQVFAYLEREDFRHQKLTLEPSLKPLQNQTGLTESTL